MNVMDLIAARLAAPKNFRVTTLYESGNTRIHDTETLSQAENYATGERRKIGRDLIERATGKKVRVVSVEINAL
ncbi:MAG: hypothetical protein EOS04_24370 [Mesorhizobium sp.]|nr:MAG: hypothetical protein EOR98_26710 [Mesorhizobium sp.]RWN73167.1 MAG: hypothetical protein EOS01_26845 [Mesorhizobium sp.]RWN85179.1 MAG: hypothetical protein EOS04_24370 [Mesorhizobium sp.]